jgi:hypothetical protein
MDSTQISPENPLNATPTRIASWLDQWPISRRSTVANWFYAAVRKGHTTPRAIVAEVAQTIAHRLDWSPDPAQREWLCQVQEAFHQQPTAAETYAASVVATERLPKKVRLQQKHEKAKPFLLESMRGKPVTDAQTWKLRTLGYRGPQPSDRADASRLIDALQQQGVTHA